MFSPLIFCRVKRHSAPRILCSEQRDYSSSGMIKYVPKKSRQISENLTSQSVDGSEKGICNGSRLDNSVLRSEVKGNGKEAKEGTFLDLQETNDAGSYMNEVCDDSNEGIVSLDKGINASRWDHSGLGLKVKNNIKKTAEGTFLHLPDNSDSGIYCDASYDDSNEGIMCFMQARFCECNILFLKSNN